MTAGSRTVGWHECSGVVRPHAAISMGVSKGVLTAVGSVAHHWMRGGEVGGEDEAWEDERWSVGDGGGHQTKFHHSSPGTSWRNAPRTGRRSAGSSPGSGSGHGDESRRWRRCRTATRSERDGWAVAGWRHQRRCWFRWCRRTWSVEWVRWAGDGSGGHPRPGHSW